jgi:hypothetical protein
MKSTTLRRVLLIAFGAATILTASAEFSVVLTDVDDDQSRLDPHVEKS